jgi:hypothetical protein
MDIEDIRHDCVQGCTELSDVCLFGNGSFYTCLDEYTRCMGHCAAVAREASDVRHQSN